MTQPNLKVESFQEFLELNNLTLEEIIEYSDNSGRNLLQRAADDNNSSKISISSLFIFSENHRYRNRNIWLELRNRWDVIVQNRKRFPYYRQSHLIKYNLNKIGGNKEFDEELL